MLLRYSETREINVSGMFFLILTVRDLFENGRIIESAGWVKRESICSIEVYVHGDRLGSFFFLVEAELELENWLMLGVCRNSETAGNLVDCPGAVREPFMETVGDSLC